MKKPQIFLKRIGIDILGVLLILASGLIGWMPGPGGFPLFFAGLGLLSINHDWAKKVLIKSKEHSDNLSKFIFRDNLILNIIYDILGICLLFVAGYIFVVATKNIYFGIAMMILLIGGAILIGNKKRISRLNKWIKKITKKYQ